MSVDLTVPTELNESAQYVEDQQGNKSSVALTELESSGRVGIATESPLKRLSINGLNDANNNNEYIGFHDGATDQLRWHINGGLAAPHDGLNFVESGVADYRLYLEPGGNVGVGTGAPQAKLDVNGGVKASRLDVAGTMTLSGSSLRIENLPTPPPGVTTVDLVVDTATNRIYRQR